MRILTNSPFNSTGLISIIEATEDAPQKIFFCIPIDNYDAEKIRTLDEFRRYFRSGITTKIKESDTTKTINLEFRSNSRFIFKKVPGLPTFIATVKNHRVDFYLSKLNFLDSDSQNTLNFDFHYVGKIFDKLLDKKLVILEPNLKQLDQLFIEEQILFSDWE